MVLFCSLWGKISSGKDKDNFIKMYNDLSEPSASACVGRTMRKYIWDDSLPMSINHSFSRDRWVRSMERGGDDSQTLEQSRNLCCVRASTVCNL